MSISEIQIVPVKPQDGLIAFVSCVLDGGYFIGSIAVHTKLGGGYRLVYPTKLLGDRQLHYHHPITREMGKQIEEAIIPVVERMFSTHS